MNIIPERTVLFSLEPIGVGSSWSEALHSYFGRLATAHRLSPWVLFNFLNKNSLKNHRRQEIAVLDLYWGKIYDALSHATAKNLSFLTVIPWMGLIRRERVYRRCHAWCPLCLREFAIQHTPLLWQLADVHACPHHGLKLCTHCDGCGIPQISFDAIPNFICRKCGAGAKDSKVKPASDFEVLVADHVSELITLTPGLGSTQICPNTQSLATMGDVSFRRLPLSHLVYAADSKSLRLVDFFRPTSGRFSLTHLPDPAAPNSPQSAFDIFREKFEMYRFRQSSDTDVISLRRIQVDFDVCYRTAQKWQRLVVDSQLRRKSEVHRRRKYRRNKLAQYEMEVSREREQAHRSTRRLSLPEAEAIVAKNRPGSFAPTIMRKLSRRVLVDTLQLIGERILTHGLAKEIPSRA